MLDEHMAELVRALLELGECPEDLAASGTVLDDGGLVGLGCRVCAQEVGHGRAVFQV